MKKATIRVTLEVDEAIALCDAASAARSRCASEWNSVTGGEFERWTIAAVIAKLGLRRIESGVEKIRKALVR